MPITRGSWKPGQSGNPRGAPKRGLSLTEFIRLELERRDNTAGKSYAQLLIEVLVAAARSGDMRAITEILDRVDGKVPQAHRLSGPGGEPLLPALPDDELKDYARRILGASP